MSEKSTLSIWLLDKTGSTNRYLIEKAREGLLKNGQAVLAREQTRGRGRLGRDFFSPGGTGMYLSVYYRTIDAEEALLYTPLCACAVCAVLEKEGLKPGIKWVNDIYLEGRKVCGILCEKAEGGVVCGIGLNLSTPPGGFPEAVKQLAGALDNGMEALPTAERVLAFLPYFFERPQEALAYYRERMLLTGHSVTLPDGKPARVLGISDRYGLNVLLPGGEEKEIICGEITLHGQMPPSCPAAQPG